MTSTDEHVPIGRWEFDDQVTAVFDDMLARSIPDYQQMRDTTSTLAARHAPDGATVVDVGCSRGGAIADLVRHRPACRFVGLEVSEPMADAARRRFVDAANVEIRTHDLREGIPADLSASVTLAVLTVQFTPIEYRPALLASIRETTDVLLIVEKVLGADARIDSTMVDVYYQHKRRVGYTDEQIDAKRHSLEGALVPVTAGMNEEFLRAAGFGSIDCYWRWMNFAGWVAY